ncbi:zinc finger protein 362 isoform X3 [Callorhinchus milii]|uniref:zinc finger protein 362 isoform X3 n=1 Tax=Callorhinchus milii TaxID=7868 RepID=UPI001C3FB63E|nr:zinc finger protein 362 isoform X3 [Callorhinchus milii]
MAESRFNNPYFWPPPPSMSGQLDNLMLINKIKEQLMAEKIRSPHMPPTTIPSQQPLLVPTTSQSLQSQLAVLKPQQLTDIHTQSPQPDVALHARPATSSMSGHSISTSTGTSDSISVTSAGQSRMEDAPAALISSLVSHHQSMEASLIAKAVGQPGMLRNDRGRKKIKGENCSGGAPVLVVPYPILASGTEPTKDGKTYRLDNKRCKICPLTFFSKSEMQIHSKSHTEAKPHKCPHCSKSFANASYLAQHLRIHLGVKPYHCSYCEKSFRQLSHLQQHTRIHTGDRPYKCAHPGCEKAFTQLSNLQSHQRQHNKDKPYKCPNCYRAYTDSASLQIHLSTHTVKHAKAYCCSMCGRAYTSETYLIKHMAKHTGVEHTLETHSPQRTQSPSCPVRISLI